jgi:hypothetical protein
MAMAQTHGKLLLPTRGSNSRGTAIIAAINYLVRERETERYICSAKGRCSRKLEYFRNPADLQSVFTPFISETAGASGPIYDLR